MKLSLLFFSLFAALPLSFAIASKNQTSAEPERINN
jgi:hypothetical protein